MPDKYKRTGRKVGRPRREIKIAGGHRLRPDEVFKLERRNLRDVVPFMQGRGSPPSGHHTVPLRDLYRTKSGWTTRLRAETITLPDSTPSHTVPLRALYRTELAWLKRVEQELDVLTESKGGLELHAPNG